MIAVRHNFLLPLIVVIVVSQQQQCRGEDKAASPPFIHPSSVQGTVGGTFNLSCYLDSSGYEGPETWLYNSTNLTLTERHRVVREEGSAMVESRLVTTDARLEDSGYYQCVVTTKSGDLLDSGIAYVLIGAAAVTTVEASAVDGATSLDQYFGPMITGMLAFVALILFSAVVVILLKHRRCTLCQDPPLPSIQQVHDFSQQGPSYIVTVEDESPEYISRDRRQSSPSEKKPDVIPPSPGVKTLSSKISSETLNRNTPSQELLPDKPQEKLAFPLITSGSSGPFEPLYAEPKKTNLKRRAPSPPPIPPKTVPLEDSEPPLNPSPDTVGAKEMGAKPPSLKPVKASTSGGPGSITSTGPNPSPPLTQAVASTSRRGPAEKLSDTKEKAKKDNRGKSKNKKVTAPSPSSTWKDDKVVYAELDFSREVGMNIIVPEEGQEPLNTTFVLRAPSKTS